MSEIKVVEKYMELVEKPKPVDYVVGKRVENKWVTLLALLNTLEKRIRKFHFDIIDDISKMKKICEKEMGKLDA